MLLIAAAAAATARHPPLLVHGRTFYAAYLPVQRGAGRLDVMRENLDHRRTRRRSRRSGAGFGRQEADGRARDAGELRHHERREAGRLPLDVTMLMMVAPAGFTAIYLRFFVHHKTIVLSKKKRKALACVSPSSSRTAQNPTVGWW